MYPYVSLVSPEGFARNVTNTQQHDEVLQIHNEDATIARRRRYNSMMKPIQQQNNENTTTTW